MWDIIRTFEPDRIDHGNQAIRDEALIEYLVETQLPLTLCPMSNIALHVYDDISQHPAVALLDRGVLVTINSDDQPFTQNSLVDNYVRLADAFLWSTQEIADLARNSFVAAYSDESQTAGYLSVLDSWLSS